MNKKVILSLAAVLVCVLSLVGIKLNSKQDVSKGNKNITIEILSEADKLEESFEVETEVEFLAEALTKQEGFVIENGMITMVSNIDLKNSKSDYWHISINGEDAQVGANELSIKNGDKIKFERKSFL